MPAAPPAGRVRLRRLLAIAFRARFAAGGGLDQPALLDRGLDEAREQRMRVERLATSARDGTGRR